MSSAAAAPEAGSTQLPQFAPLAKYKLVFLGEFLPPFLRLFAPPVRVCVCVCVPACWRHGSVPAAGEGVTLFRQRVSAAAGSAAAVGGSVEQWNTAESHSGGRRADTSLPVGGASGHAGVTTQCAAGAEDRRHTTATVRRRSACRRPAEAPGAAERKLRGNCRWLRVVVELRSAVERGV